jgi:hypothetical protein
MLARERTEWALAVALSFALLLAPAAWNGFPFIFPDTGSYLTGPLDGTLEFGRSAFYGLFFAAGMKWAFWPNVVAQAALIVWLIVLTLRAQGLARPWLALGIVALLAVGSSLPWVAGMLMPDILFPAAVLALYLLIFRVRQLKPWERYALAAVVACAMVSHMAAAALCIALCTAAWLIVRFSRPAWPRAHFVFAAGAVAAGLVLAPIANGAITGTFAFTPGGMSFLFSRMVESGIVGRYLKEHCPDPALQLCAYRTTLSTDSDTWLWSPNSPFNKMERNTVEAEERVIILATLAHYPLMHVTAAADEAFAQLLAFQTEISFADNEPTAEAIARFLPRFTPQLQRARQQHGAIDVALLNWLHVPIAALAMLGTAGALVFRRRLHLTRAATAFSAMVVLAVLLNAAICGVFSHAVDRYESRLTPLALLALAMLVFDRQRRGIE